MPNRRQFLQLAGIGTAASLTAGGGMVRALSPADNSSPAPPREQIPFSLPPDLFPILPWDTLHGWGGADRKPKNGLESIAECNFTLAGFVKPEDLPLCEKLGLAAIMAPFLGKELWLKLSGEEIEKRVKRGDRANRPQQGGAGLFPRGRAGSSGPFPGWPRRVAAVKKYAPGKLAYINLFPSYATVGASGQLAARNGHLHGIRRAIRGRGEAATAQLRQLHGRVFRRPEGLKNPRPSISPICWKFAGSRRKTACPSGTSSPAINSARKRPSRRPPIWPCKPIPRWPPGDEACPGTSIMRTDTLTPRSTPPAKRRTPGDTCKS